MLKSKLRKKILKVRQKFNTKNIQLNFNQIIKIIKKEKITNKIIGGYYPVNFEIDDLTLLRKFKKNKEDYEKIIEAAADEIENFVEKANLENLVQ